MEGRVVVVVKPSVYRHKTRDTFLARCGALRLTTAYGKSEEAAIVKLKQLFNNEINYHRSHGQLEKRLNKLGVEWYWADDYGSDYEDTDLLVETVSEPTESGGFVAIPNAKPEPVAA